MIVTTTRVVYHGSTATGTTRESNTVVPSRLPLDETIVAARAMMEDWRTRLRKLYQVNADLTIQVLDLNDDDTTQARLLFETHCNGEREGVPSKEDGERYYSDQCKRRRSK